MESVKNEFEDFVQKEASSEEKVTGTNEFLHPREKYYLERQRSKTRLFDPKSVYLYRHVKPSFLSSALHLFTLLISLSFVGFYFWFFINLTTDSIMGVGKVSNLTFIDMAEVLLIALIVFSSVHSLRGKLTVNPMIRYGLAMFSNSMNRAVLDCVKVIVAIISIVGLLAFSVQKDIKQFKEIIENGVVNDLISAFLTFVFVVVFIRGLRFCFKEICS